MNRTLRKRIIKSIIAWGMIALPRAGRTFAQTFAAGLTTAVAEHLTLGEIEWGHVISVAVVSAIFSLAMSAAGTPEKKLKEENAELKERLYDEDYEGNDDDEDETEV